MRPVVRLLRYVRQPEAGTLCQSGLIDWLHKLLLWRYDNKKAFQERFAC